MTNFWHFQTSVKRPLTASQRARSPTTKMFHISIDPAIASLDYCHRRPFLPQTRQFKQIILETLIRRIKCVKMPSDFLDTNLAIKELMAVFTLEHQCQIGDIPANVIDEEGNVNQALLANYATNHRSQFVGRSGVGEDAKKAGFMDDLEKGLKWAKVERIRKNRDLTEELYEYVNVLATQTGCVVRKRIDRITSDSMEKFFCSVTPMMTFQAFLRNLLGMLYNVFLMEYQKHENGSDATIMKKRRKINYDELFSQYQAVSFEVLGELMVINLFIFLINLVTSRSSRIFSEEWRENTRI